MTLLAAYVPLNPDPYSGHQMILRLCGQPQTVLDAGGSSGYLAAVLRARGARVVVLDRDREALAAARRAGLETVEADLAASSPTLPDAVFDLVVCADVIEHLPDPTLALAHLLKVMVPDGRLICSVPNGANWALRLSLLAGRWEYRDRGLLDRTHLRVFTRRSFHATVRAAGYEVVHAEQSCPIPWHRGGLMSAAAQRAASVLPGLLAYQHIVVARPAGVDPGLAKRQRL